jgi:hypothetical protein
MTQNTQFLMTKNGERRNVLAADLETYLADGWQIINVEYGLDEERTDDQSQALMINGSDAINVRPADAPAYEADGYRANRMIYGASLATVNGAGAISILDEPSPEFVSGEVGNVDEFTVAVTFDKTIVDIPEVVIKVNGSAATIDDSSADDTDVAYVLHAAVENGDTVTLEYLHESHSITNNVSA